MQHCVLWRVGVGELLLDLAVEVAFRDVSAVLRLPIQVEVMFGGADAKVSAGAPTAVEAARCPTSSQARIRATGLSDPGRADVDRYGNKLRHRPPQSSWKLDLLKRRHPVWVHWSDPNEWHLSRFCEQ